MNQQNQQTPATPATTTPLHAGDGRAVLDQIVEQQGKVVVRDDDAGAMTMWDEAAVAVRCNFDDKTPAGRQLGSKLRMKADQKLNDIVGAELHVVAYLAHPCQVVSFADGQVLDKIRLAMYLADGSTVDTMSDPFVKGFAYVALRAGSGMWDPPIQFETKKIPMQGGKAYFVCAEKVSAPPLNNTEKKTPAKK